MILVPPKFFRHQILDIWRYLDTHCYECSRGLGWDSGAQTEAGCTFSDAQWYPKYLHKAGRHDIGPSGVLCSYGEAAEQHTLWSIQWLQVLVSRHLNHFLFSGRQNLLQIQRCPRWLYANVALNILPQPLLGTSVSHCVLRGKMVTKVVVRICVQIHNFPSEKYFCFDLWKWGS